MTEINETMPLYEDPCGYHVCEPPAVIDEWDVIEEAAETPYNVPDFQIGPGKDFISQLQVIKAKKVYMAAGGKVQFDLRQPFDWYAIIIDELHIRSPDENDYDLDFGWLHDGFNDISRENFRDLRQDLKGRKGARGPNRPITQRGYEGFPGGTGERGGTRHSPDIFVFIRTVVGNDDDLDLTSFRFTLNGHWGGDGGDGGDGGNGDRGKRGKKGRQATLTRACKSGKRGRRGGAPGRGGRGGDGGCGGSGAEVHVYYGDGNLRSILERSKFNLNGAPRGSSSSEGIGLGGMPGKAGKPGRGGRGGRRAGNCDSGKEGPTGLPSIGSTAHKKWNLGKGRPSTQGPNGDYELVAFDRGSIIDAIYNEPSP